MFKKALREIEKLKQIQIPVDTDEEGYYDRECPSADCMFQFKVKEEDWTEKFKDESVFCPLCGHNAPADQFWTTEQVEFAKEQALRHIKSKLNKALADGAMDFNRRQPKSGFLTMKMHFKGSVTNSYILPIPAKKELELKLTCSKCGSRYSVLGSAFFCPCCGYNSVIETFDNSIKKIESKIKNINVIRQAVTEISPDEAEITVQSLIETGLSDGVVAFQRFCELTYKNNVQQDKKIKFNAFQNLEVGADYWKELIGESYKNWLTDSEFRDLTVSFQNDIY